MESEFNTFKTTVTNDVETDPKLLSKAPTIEDLKTNLMEEIQNEEQI